MTFNNIKDFKPTLKASKNIVITTHKNPDGDAIGSSLALHLFLNQLGLKSTVIVPNDYPEFLKWLPEESSVLKFEDNKSEFETLVLDADLIFALDYNAFHRTGDLESVLEKSTAKKVMIDHHQQPDNFAEFTFSNPEMSSTCEMIYHFIESLNELKQINSEIATCIYVGIMTDTGSFRYRSTTATTHHVIAELINKGADNTKIHNSVFDANSFNKLQILGTALKNLNILPEFNTAYISLSQKELNEFDYKKGDTEGVVNYALSINNCVLAAIFIEDEKNNIIKISFRSKGDFSVNELSRKHFEGGGHNNAAGGKSNDSLENTIDRFISILPEYKTALQNEV
jgi:phosphoesterase RecJ-like protein|tara:strand:- start:178 stop:1200 length:1023 start_codon:yes stop_codon:yes gene_type:complete